MVRKTEDPIVMNKRDKPVTESANPMRNITIAVIAAMIETKESHLWASLRL
jgi:hypothetical protein